MHQYVVVKQMFIAQTVINNPGSILPLLPEKGSKLTTLIFRQTFSAMAIHLYIFLCKLNQH